MGPVSAFSAGGGAGPGEGPLAQEKTGTQSPGTVGRCLRRADSVRDTAEHTCPGTQSRAEEPSHPGTVWGSVALSLCRDHAGSVVFKPQLRPGAEQRRPPCVRQADGGGWRELTLQTDQLEPLEKWFLFELEHRDAMWFSCP